MQLYAMTQREITQDILNRAEEAGYEALVFTVDSNVFGNREWDRRSYRAPAKLTLRNMLDVARHPRWVWDVLVPHGIPRFENIADFMPPEAKSADAGVAIVTKLFAPDITWKDVELAARGMATETHRQGHLVPLQMQSGPSRPAAMASSSAITGGGNWTAASRPSRHSPALQRK